ncbi:Xylosidase/arabinosidase [Exophiala dermatitidis]
MTDPKPLVTHIYTADPSAHVFEGKLYIYPSHLTSSFNFRQDRETDIPFNDNGDQYDMADYHVLSLSDPFESPPQVTDHGVALQASDVPWVSKQLWAPDAATKDGKYYLYFPARDKQSIFRIGVAVADGPEGPFKPDPEPIAGSYSIDPASFVDDDGQAYLYFGGIWGGQLQCWTKAAGAEGGSGSGSAAVGGAISKGEGEAEGKDNDEHKAKSATNTNASTIAASEWHFDPTKSGPQEPQGHDTPALLPRVAKLSADMRSFASPVQEIQILDPATGKLLPADDHDRRFFEAAWMHKYRGKYYFSYSTGDTHYVVYAVGDSPLGPFVYAGRILEPVSGWTTHHSIVEYRGKWWLFYHDCELSGGVDHLRSVKMRELVYDGQGRIRLKEEQKWK